MAIQFARIEIVGRSEGKNACLKSAYNARLIIKDERTNVTYNFSKKAIMFTMQFCFLLT